MQNRKRNIAAVTTIAVIQVSFAACSGSDQSNHTGSATKSPQESVVSMPAPNSLTWPRDQMAGQLSDSDKVALAKVRPCVDAAAVLPDSIGPVHVDMTTADLLRRCPEVLTRWDWGDEGIPEPAAFVPIGKSVVEVVFEDTLKTSRAYLIHAEDSLMRSPSGVGVGSSVAELTKQFGQMKLEEAECSLYATFERAPGIVFRIATPNELECENIERLLKNPAVLDRRSTVWRVTLFRRNGV